MHLKPLRCATALITAAALCLALAATPSSASADPPMNRDHGAARHVLLLSIDGLHQSDLNWYVQNHPQSALAQLVHGGATYTQAQTPIPSDSFPGMVAQVTGGNPKTTGIFYDATFNDALLPPGTTDCQGVKPGTPVNYDESIDKDPTSIDAGQGLAGLPDSILGMTGQPQTLINPAALPVDPRTCKPVFPNQYLKVNTIFEVARQAGLRTAWSDKHPSYSILDGPSGTGVQDLFTPEINSNAPDGGDWTTDNAFTEQYDSFKVQSVLNEIDGLDHSGKTHVGVPGLFGMNFQTVSTAQKLPTSDELAGGYLADGVTPGPLLSRALDFVNTSVGAFVSDLFAQEGLGDSTTIVLSAKHGQSPQDGAALRRVPDSPIIDGIDAAWRAAHPGAGPLVAAATDDDIMQLWLNDHSQSAADFVKAYLLSHGAAANTISGAATTVADSGLTTAFAGREVATFFGDRPGDPRLPDVLGLVQHGVVYTGGQSKIAEHGGADPQDRDVPIVVAGHGVAHGLVVNSQVETTQIAPTILALLGLPPAALQAVDIEHTRVLPGI